MTITAACPPSDNSWLEQVHLFEQLLPAEQIEQQMPCAKQALFTPLLTLHLMIYQRLNNNANLQQAVDHLYQHFPKSLLPQGKEQRFENLSLNSGAYSQARTRLKLDLTRELAESTFQTLVATYPPSYQGRRAFLFDGTTVTLSPVAALREAFPPAINQHGSSPWPLMHVVTAVELASGLAMVPQTGAMYGPKAQGEVELAEGLLDRLPPNSLVMGDGNFGIFAFTYAVAHRGHQVLVRLSKTRFESLKKKAQPLGEGCWSCDWHPSAWDRKSHPDLPAEAHVEGWLLSYRLPDGEYLYLFVTFACTASEGAEVYKERWAVETNIRDWKQTLQIESFRGRSKEMVEKELMIAVVCYNLTVQVRRLAAQKAKVPPRRLSFKGVWTLVITFLEAIVDVTDEETLQRKFERLLRGASQRKLPNRKKGRKYAREAYAKRRKFPPRKLPENQAKPEQQSTSDRT